MDKIKVDLHVLYETVVVGQVLSMPEKYRGVYKIRELGGYALESAGIPEARLRSLFLHGNDISRDNRPFLCRFDSNKDCQAWVDAMRTMIDLENALLREVHDTEDCVEHIVEHIVLGG